MASLQEIREGVVATGVNLGVVRQVAGQWSLVASVQCERPLADWENVFDRTVYAPARSYRQASELLIASLAKFEPPIIVTEDDVFLSAEATAFRNVMVSATYPLDKEHSIVAEANEAAAAGL